jgi:hypothetical protein
VLVTIPALKRERHILYEDPRPVEDSPNESKLSANLKEGASLALGPVKWGRHFVQEFRYQKCESKSEDTDPHDAHDFHGLVHRLILVQKIFRYSNMDFITWTIDEDLHVDVDISIQKFIEHQHIRFDDVKELILDIRTRCKTMVIRADLAGANLFWLDVRSLTNLLVDVFYFTREDMLLQAIEFQNSGFIFRNLYRPISLAIPRHVRALVVFT